MNRLTMWMRAVGALYLFLFVAATFLRLPIIAEGPPGLLELAAAGDPAARFTVDTWVMIGLFFLVIGAALLFASRKPEKSMALVWTVIAGELVWGIGIDIYKLLRGIVPPAVPCVWIVIHLVVIVTGWIFLRIGQRTANV